MKKTIKIIVPVILGVLLVVLLCLCKSSNSNVQEYGEAAEEATDKVKDSSLNSLIVAWDAYLEADSLSKANEEPVSDELRDVPKIICDKLLALDADLQGKTDSASLALSETYLRFIEDIYKVVGKDSGVKLDNYGRVVRLTHDKYGKEIPTGEAIAGWKVRLSDAYVEEGKSAVELWQLDGNPKEKTRANSDFKKALELNPQNSEAEKELEKIY